ncbi:hypothetical protein WMY93_018347 [Mugilogobius chulae]|uniref:Fibronectin type-III domain-containing protein n=1 Tax=Mugilogobius chulae TaxID=88201 RepID=A0AAW0NJR4_9GOBI
MMCLIHSSSKSVQQKRPSWAEILEECLSKNNPVDVWVVPDTKPACVSPKTRVTMKDTIKYEKPQNVSVRWTQNNLTLEWTAPESFQAKVQIRHHVLTLVKLENSSAQHLQIKHQSTDATTLCGATGPPSSPCPSVSNYQHSALSQKHYDCGNKLLLKYLWMFFFFLEFTRISKKLNYTKSETKLQRRITLKWKPVSNADGEAVLYKVETLTFKNCRCHKLQGNTSRTYYRTYGSYSAFDISVWALNDASSSPKVFFHVPPENPPNLKPLNIKTKQCCIEWYELKDGKVKEDTVIAATSKNVSREIDKVRLKDFTPYIYFEHQCEKKTKTQFTKKMCLYYKIQGKCRNISSSLRKYVLEGLSPSTKYNISLMGVTAAGEGPQVRITINTPPEKPYNVVLSFGLLVSFFVLSISCTFIFTRMKNKVLPPVPTPVIPGFTANQPEIQNLMERKEEVHKVTLVQLHPECCPPESGTKDRTLDGTRDKVSQICRRTTKKRTRLHKQEVKKTTDK